MSDSLESLRAALVSRLAEVEELANENLLDQAHPSVRLIPRRATAEEISPGESRFGGLPDVPPDFEWPRWRPFKPVFDLYGEEWQPDDPAPISFLAQLELGALPRVDEAFPETGWLYFFFDQHCMPWGDKPAHRGACRVLYSNVPRAELRRATLPDDADSEEVGAWCRLEARPDWTLPERTSFDEGDERFDAYQEFCAGWNESQSETHHRLGGHPQLVQDPMEHDCHFAANGFDLDDPFDRSHGHLIRDGIDDWRLLAQFDSDNEPGWCWCDSGRIYFWIRKQDLAARDFSRVWLILQSY